MGVNAFVLGRILFALDFCYYILSSGYHNRKIWRKLNRTMSPETYSEPNKITAAEFLAEKFVDFSC